MILINAFMSYNRCLGYVCIKRIYVCFTKRVWLKSLISITGCPWYSPGCQRESDHEESGQCFSRNGWAGNPP